MCIKPKDLPVILALLLFVCCATVTAKTIYVDADAPGANNGTSWQNAYLYLQDALTNANSSSKPVEIRVARGVYRPDADRVHPQGTGDRNATFGLINGVMLTGGYAGFGEPDPNARDIEAYETILSGDLNGDDATVADPCDIAGEPTWAENCYHVVTANDTDATAVLDGFTITGGQDDRQECFEEMPGVFICVCMAYGAGIYNSAGSATIRNCTIEWNSAYRIGFHGGEAYGGGMYNTNGGSPTLTNCTFSHNWANAGGGMHNNNSSPVLVDCEFVENSARFQGAGMDNTESDPMLTRCVFTDNSTQNGGAISAMWAGPILTGCTLSNNQGGAVYVEEGSPVLVDCLLSGNSGGRGGAAYFCTSFGNTAGTFIGCTFRSNLGRNGGAIYAEGSRGSTTLAAANCLFADNTATERGGGLYTYAWHGSVMLNLDNCTFNGNMAFYGGAAYNKHQSSSEGSVDVRIESCIFWCDAGNEIQNEGDPTVTVAYSDVQDGWPGQGNKDSDPRFADVGTGDYHLKSQAGRYDPDSQTWVQDDVTSPCIDAGDPMSPVMYEPFPNGGIVNMGAYGGTAEASKSYFGGPVCEIILAGDINGDCRIDFLDFRLMALHWLDDKNK